jgi:ABC-2 type transport system ATP-binding protein
VEPGQILGLLGPNGAGKSTLIGACTTRVVPTSGSVRVDGIDVAADPVAAKRDIGVVAQHNTLDRSVSVRENLYLHCRYFGITSRAAHGRAEEPLDVFALTDRRRALVATLSGGRPGATNWPGR